MELELISLLSQREVYDKYIKYFPLERLGPESQDIIKALPEWYSETGKDLVDDWREYYIWYSTIKHPSLSQDKAGILEAVTNKLAMLGPVTPAVADAFVERDVAAQVADMAYDIVAGNKGGHSLEDVYNLLSDAKLQTRQIHRATRGMRINSGNALELLEETEVSEKWHWRLNELEISVGPIKQGDFIIMGARPDSGKTTWLASEMTYMAEQVPDDSCVLWINNEEDITRINDRQICAALNWTKAECDKNKHDTVERYYAVLGGPEKLITVDYSGISIIQVEELLEQYKPKVLVIDQLWKLQGYERQSSNEIERFSKIATHLRQLAKEYCPIIVTSQVDRTAENEKYPDMSCLYNSKTAVQGEADVILMLGRDKEEPDNMRFIHAPKNKLPFGQDKHRNTGWAIELDRQRARFISKVGRP